MKTADLTGPALDYWVAKAEGMDESRAPYSSGLWMREGAPVCGVAGVPFTPSLSWEFGGEIIERERMEVVPVDGVAWEATSREGGGYARAATPLIAAMRAYVASKLGEEVSDA